MTDKEILKQMNKDYKLIPMTQITAEARLLAIRWSKNMVDDFIDQRHKLASDVMNFTRRAIKESLPEIQRLTTTLSLIRPLAFRDPNDAAWAMEEIRKVLNAYDKNK